MSYYDECVDTDGFADPGQAKASGPAYNAEPTPLTLYIAVVVREDNYKKNYVSFRKDGDQSAFISTDRDNAIQRALVAAREWGEKSGTKYIVYTGTLNHKAVAHELYRLEALRG